MECGSLCTETTQHDAETSPESPRLLTERDFEKSGSEVNTERELKSAIYFTTVRFTC